MLQMLVAGPEVDPQLTRSNELNARILAIRQEIYRLQAQMDQDVQELLRLRINIRPTSLANVRRAKIKAVHEYDSRDS